MANEYKVSKKINDKWVTLGNVKTNQWGNLSLGLHCTQQFKEIVASTEDGKWLNLSLFEEKEKVQ
jgi:hypothetical protein